MNMESVVTTVKQQLLPTKTERTATPGFAIGVGKTRISLPWPAVTVLLAAAIGAWAYVSKINIEHGGTYVRIKGITTQGGRHLTNVYERVEQPR